MKARLCPEDSQLAGVVARFMEEELGVPLKGGRFILAVSGGSDSVALLLLFSALRARGAWISAAHLDHGLREESAGEARFVQQLCASLDVPCEVRRVDAALMAAEWHCGTEDAARRIRYGFLEECRLKADAGWVLTAHHTGDLAEDVVMRLMRGALWPALGGMRARVEEPGRRILRPLLMQDKERLRAVPEHLGITWAEDATNAEPCCLRNRVRLEIMPLFLRENPSFHEAVRRMWRTARLDEADYRSMQDACLEEKEEEKIIVLHAEALAGCSRADFGRLAVEAVRRMHCGQARESVIDAMAQAWSRRLFPRRFSFPGGVKAEMDARGIVFRIAPGR